MVNNPPSPPWRILDIDLSRSTIQEFHVSDEHLRKYIGGVGLAASILWEETSAQTDPLGPENPLLVMTGPLSATAAPSSGRYIVAALSPQTGIWGEAHAGGTFAHRLRSCGYLGIIFRGKSPAPVYLKVTPSRVSLEDATSLWGLGVENTHARLMLSAPGEGTTLLIGPAGENLVRFASIVSDGPRGRCAGRCGLGAVMGAKRLKGLLVSGIISHRGQLSSSPLAARVGSRYRNRLVPGGNFAEQADKFFGLIWDWDGVPARNWQVLSPKELKGMFLSVLKEGKSWLCSGCFSGCLESSLWHAKRRPVFEAAVPLGTQCWVRDPSALRRFYHFCNDQGLDCISAGNTVAFYLDALERGLLEHHSGLKPEQRWGDINEIEKILNATVLREGVGHLLAEGTVLAAQSLGPEAAELAVHIKGLDLPGHLPSSHVDLGLGFATCNRGGCHLSAFGAPSFGPLEPFLASFSWLLNKPLKKLVNRILLDYQGPATAVRQNISTLFDTLVCCKYLGARRINYRARLPVALSDLREWLNLTTHWDISEKELPRAGERVFTVQRMINVRRGIRAAHDHLPPRVLRLGVESLGIPSLNEKFSRLLASYYQARGWDENGVPRPEKLRQLGLEELAMEKH